MLLLLLGAGVTTPPADTRGRATASDGLLTGATTATQALAGVGASDQALSGAEASDE